MAKAYVVTEERENTGAIFFAEHAVVARRMGANELADGEFSLVTCRRAPWADAYTDGVPARVCIAHGWRFECHGCGAHIDEDWLYDNGLPVSGVVGMQSGAVYCSGRCMWKDMKRRARRKAEEEAAIEAFKNIVRRRFPDADFDGLSQHAYVVQTRGIWIWHQVIIAFRFPGMKFGPAHYRLDTNSGMDRREGPWPAKYTCCAGDKEAFEAWAAQATGLKPGAERQEERLGNDHT